MPATNTPKYYLSRKAYIVVGAMDGDTENEQWGARVVETPRDGSCFFSSIAMAMNDSIDMWCSEEKLRVKMEQYWEEYTRVSGKSPENVTPELIRFMCSLNVDENMLEAYNQEAKFRKKSLNEKNTRIFSSVESLGKHMRKRTTWGDQACLHAFLKSLDYRCGIVVFDADIGGMVRFPEEWTKDKSTYICLRRQNHHYNVLQFGKKDTNTILSMCLTRECLVEMLKDVYGVESLSSVKEIPIF